MPDGSTWYAPEGLGQVCNRITNKNPIRFGRTGLDAVTRLRVGELRFRKGQYANVHRLIVAGGGPFLTVRCRDRSTHSIPQESSAGRNLITVFCDVNNPVHFFSGALPARPADDDGHRGSLGASVSHRDGRHRARHFLKTRK